MLEKLKICFEPIIVTSLRATAKTDTFWSLSDREIFNLFSSELYEESGDGIASMITLLSIAVSGEMIAYVVPRSPKPVMAWQA